MKAAILLLLLGLVAIGHSTSLAKVNGSRANLIVGGVTAGNRLLYRQYVYRPPVANIIQSEDLVYRGNASTYISAVQAFEVGATQYASVWIINGGIGRNNVTVRFQSSRGWGYYYDLSIWGR